jgi:hypothetical protein
MRSTGFKVVKQLGQWEGGNTTDSFRGILNIHTFKNEPVKRPIKIDTNKKKSCMF